MIVNLSDMENMRFYPRANLRLPPRPQKGMEVIYLLGDNFQTSLKMTGDRKLIDIAHIFRYFFRPIRYKFKLFNVPIRRLEITEHKKIQAAIKEYPDRPYRAYEKLKFTDVPGNLFYDLSRYNEIFASRVVNRPIRKCIDEYFKMLAGACVTPRPICMVPSETYIDLANVVHIKSNPILLVYYALMKSEKSLKLLNDVRLLALSERGAFIVTPSTLDRQTSPKFKTILRRTLTGSLEGAIDNEKVDNLVNVDEVESDAVNVSDEGSTPKHIFQVNNPTIAESSPSPDQSIDSLQTKVEKDSDRSIEARAITNLEELLDFCRNVPYGIWDSKNQLLYTSQIDILQGMKVYKTMSYTEFSHGNGGLSYDFTLFEYETMKMLGKKPMAYLIYGNSTRQSHAFIVIPTNGKFVYLEACDRRDNNRHIGIHSANSLDSILEYVASNFPKDTKDSVLRIVQYDPTKYIGIPYKSAIDAIATLKPSKYWDVEKMELVDEYKHLDSNEFELIGKGLLKKPSERTGDEESDLVTPSPDNIQGKSPQTNPFEIPSFKNPQDLLNFCNSLNYGVWDPIKHTLANEVDSTYKKSLQNYKVQSAQELVKNGGGWCLDFVVLQHKVLTDLNFKPMTYLVSGPKLYNVHAFTIFNQGNDYIYFESSFTKRQGIRKFKSLDEAIRDASLGWNKVYGKIRKKLEIRQYNPLSTQGYSIYTFMSELGKIKPMMIIDLEAHDMEVPSLPSNAFKKMMSNLSDDEDEDYTDREEEEKNNKDDDDDDDIFSNDQDDDDDSGVFDDSLMEETDDDVDSIVESISDKTSEKKTGGKSTARTSSARDSVLRVEQKQKVVNGKTIQDIITSKGSSIPIPPKEIGTHIKSPNRGVSEMTSINFDKIYNDFVKDNDIVSIFDNLENTSSEFHILSIEKKDTSDTQTLKETWTVKLETNDRKRHSIVVDIPILYDSMYYLIDGIKYILQKQLMFLPIVKVNKNNVRLTTNYNRMTIARTNKKLNEVNQCLSTIRKSPLMKGHLVIGRSNNPKNWLTTLEYDQYANEILELNWEHYHLLFSQSSIQSIANSHKVYLDTKKIPIGYTTDGGFKILYIDPLSGKTEDGMSITDIISKILQPKIRFKPKTSNRNIFSTAKLGDKIVPTIIVLLIWEGLTKVLKRLPPRFKFMILGIDDKIPNNMLGIKWKDFILAYDTSVESQLMFNGLYDLNTDQISLEDADSITAYMDYIGRVFHTRRAVYVLNTAHELWIDPITKEILIDLDLPTDISDILIYCNALLADNGYTEETDMSLYRIRCGETLPSILHSVLATNYSSYMQSNRSRPFSIARNAVMNLFLDSDKINTLSPHSTINPTFDSIARNTISPRGFQGSNKERAYTEKKRVYDPSMVGTMSLTTSTDASSGIKREITANTNILNARGYSKVNKPTNDMTNTNLFSLSELLTVNTARFDDPYRTSMTVKQSGHQVYTKEADPCLVSNGADEALAYMCSSSFAVKAEEDGEVAEIDKDAGFAIIKYKSGTTKAIDLKQSVEHNSGGGFYVDNLLVLNDLEVGSKVSANQILAYNPRYFSASKLGGIRYKIGKMAKVAIMSSYNTYQDAGVYTQKIANALATNVVFKESIVLKPWANVSSIVNEGNHLKVGDSLIEYQEEKNNDTDIGAILDELGEELGGLIDTLATAKKQTNRPGTVIKVEMFCTVELSELSRSLRKIVEAYYDKVGYRKKVLTKYDDSSSVVKCGVLFAENDGKTKTNMYDKIGSTTVGEGVLINFYIQHETSLSIGDKVCLFTANKTIVSEIVEPGYEPYSEYRPDEEVSALVGESAILNRMTPSILLTCAENKLMIELKRKITEIWKS